MTEVPVIEKPDSFLYYRDHLHKKGITVINTNARKTDFESIAFRTFDFERILNKDSQDPDENFKGSQYFTPEESSWNLNNFDKSSLSMLHLKVP